MFPLYSSAHVTFRATTLADRLNIDFALINRKRRKGDLADSPSGNMEILVGNVKDKVSPTEASCPAHEWLILRLALLT